MGTTRAQRIGAVVRLEWLTQRREPLTVLYALVLGLLAAAFAAAGPVELVRGRGEVPRDAAWSMMLASTALVAFGQVITTMVAATVVLRDRQDRVAELLGVTTLTAREYLAGKLLAALLVLSVVYAAIPVGLVAGAVGAGGGVRQALAGSVPPFVLLVLPVMLAVGMLQFAAGVLSGRLWVLVGLGLLLIWLWSAAVGEAGGAGASWWWVVVDPFGSAPLLQATRDWSDAERRVRALPVTTALVTGRVVWLMLGATAASLAVRRGAVTGRDARAVRGGGRGVAPSRVVSVIVRGAGVAVPGGALPAWRAAVGTARYVASWMLRDAGWRVLTALGAVNVGVHAVLDARGGAADPAVVAGGVLAEHARLFLILLATIYAGELTWREREDRSAPLFDVLPVRDGALVAGRIAGAVLAQCLVWVVLVGAAAGGVAVGRGAVVDVRAIAAAAVPDVLVPFVVWLLVSLAVHVVVQQKVVGHLVCIAGWVSGVLLFDAARAGSVRLSWPTLLGVVMVALVTVLFGSVRGGGRVGVTFRARGRL